MARQRLLIMLVFMLVATPMGLAFAHYSDLGNHLSTEQRDVAGDADRHEGSSSHRSDHCQPEKSHPASCAFHVCVDCAITAFYRFIPSHRAEGYNPPEQSTLASFIFPPGIKPPITFR